MVKARKQTSIPSVWTKEELTKLIRAMDRASPKGKRDCAIIISDIIGHLDTNSTAGYLKVDIERLAQCPLDFEAMIHCE